MQTQASLADYRPQLIWGITAIVLFTSGTAAVNAWTRIPPAGDGISLTADAAAPAASLGSQAQNSGKSAEGKMRTRTTCDECGVVASTREIGRSADDDASAAPRGLAPNGRSEIPATPSRSREITVRMKDGSSHVFIETSSATWRTGERMMVVASAGAN